MKRRKVLFNCDEYIPTIVDGKRIGGKIIKHEDQKGWFLQFGITTVDENYPVSCALIEDENGNVHDCLLSDFRFTEWED